MPLVDHLRSVTDRFRELIGSSPTKGEIERGKIALDRDGENKEVLVMDVRDEHADEYVISCTDETVASYNPEYPPTNRVIEVRFAETLDAYLSEWTVAEVLEAEANRILNAGNPYYYPEGRLKSPEKDDSETQ